jgi:hypothetical protein
MDASQDSSRSTAQRPPLQRPPPAGGPAKPPDGDSPAPQTRMLQPRVACETSSCTFCQTGLANGRRSADRRPWFDAHGYSRRSIRDNNQRLAALRPAHELDKRAGRDPPTGPNPNRSQLTSPDQLVDLRTANRQQLGRFLRSQQQLPARHQPSAPRSLPTSHRSTLSHECQEPCQKPSNSRIRAESRSGSSAILHRAVLPWPTRRNLGMWPPGGPQGRLSLESQRNLGRLEPHKSRNASDETGSQTTITTNAHQRRRLMPNPQLRTRTAAHTCTRTANAARVAPPPTPHAHATSCGQLTS